MATEVVIRRHEYYDSVRLMQVSERVRQSAGVVETILMMATANNKKLLAAAGLCTTAVELAAADDLVIGVKAESLQLAAAALSLAVELLTTQAVSAAYSHRTFESALAGLPDANLALISVPGAYAAAEARRALERGLHVLLFSDNVELSDEVALKQLAQQRGLLLMGPDCGTAIINGAALGFANKVRAGNIGIVGASGTGIQEICVLLERQGCGVSQAIGTGGRDLKAEVGGITMLMGIDYLTADPATDIIVLTSKPPHPEVARRVLARAATCGKPVVVNFLGGATDAISAAGLIGAQTFAQVVEVVAQLLLQSLRLPQASTAQLTTQAATLAARLAPGQRYLRGLFAGGTLCFEAMHCVQQELGPVYSNIAMDPEYALPDLWRSQGHALVDLGDDAYTLGRAHPMIDPSLRAARLLSEAQDSEVAVILLDVVLGYGAHANPAAALAVAIAQAQAEAAAAKRYLVVIASVCGTEADPQQLSKQEMILRGAGVTIASSNGAASRLAAAVIKALTA